MSKYSDLQDPQLYSTWESYPQVNDFPAIDTAVAVKRMLMTDASQGFNREAIREVRMLRELSHPFIVKVYDFYLRGQNLFIVMETLPYDLEKLIRDSAVLLQEGHIKRYMHMILQAVAHLHVRGIVHRDIKPANLLVAPGGELKLADFGATRHVASPARRMSPEACTIWYRAPELLFGSTCYGLPSDIWSIGCVFGELLRRNALFMGEKTEISQLTKIAALMGSPSESNWPGVTSLPSYFDFAPGAVAMTMKELFVAAEPAARDLIGRMLQWCPDRRITAEEALAHPYFSTGVEMTDISKLPKRKV
jgi:cyclin-dependent kinase 7